MSIQHELLPDGKLHEPKGIVAASANTAYVANGAGTGTWKKIGSDAIKGLSGDGGVTNKLILTDGANGFVLAPAYAHGEMRFFDNGNAFAITTVADTTLQTASQYTLFTGTGAPFSSANLEGVTFSIDRLTFSKAGLYQLNFWCDITSFSGAAAKTAFRYRINGSTISTLKVISKSAAAGDMKSMSYSGFVPLAANDYIQVMIATDATGNVTIGDMILSAHLIKG